MAIRQLSDEEKKICDISINRLKKRNRQLQFYIKKSRLELNEGLKITYEKTRDELEGALNRLIASNIDNNKKDLNLIEVKKALNSIVNTPKKSTNVSRETFHCQQSCHNYYTIKSNL